MTRILSVDDEPINLAIIAESLSEDGYLIDEAEDGEAAWSLISKNRYDLIILDRMMPRLDGLSLLHRLKADPDWKAVPVIMQTAAANQNEVREGLAAGAHYYLTKPYEPDALRILVTMLIKDARELANVHHFSTSLGATLTLLEHGEFTFRTLAEAHDLAAALSSLCKEPSSVILGLLELLVNAIEHGNLCISYSEKTELRRTGCWEKEIARRLREGPYTERRARVSLQRDGDDLEFLICDEGSGFDWQPYLDFDPARAFDLNGRGIAMANNFSFSRLEYQGNGSRVLARTPAKEG